MSILNVINDDNGFADDAVNGSPSSGFGFQVIVQGAQESLSATVYGGHALRVDKWLYVPFVAAQVSNEQFDAPVTLLDDDDIVQTTQATALSEGSGITWNDETNPSSIIGFTGGSGTLSVGNTVTGGSSGADGIVTAFLEGDSTAGVIHLKTRDANDFSGTESLSNGAGWTATLTAASQQDFSIWIDGNDLSLQKIYDYFAALTSETTLSDTGELFHEWGRDSQGRAVYATGSSFFTERSYGKGVIVVDYGAGALDYFTDDAGGTYTPPASLTITIHVQDTDLADIQNAQVGIYNTADRSEIMNKDTDANGDATESYVGSPINIEIRVRKSSPGDTRYVFFSTLGSIGATNYSFTVTLREDINA